MTDEERWMDEDEFNSYDTEDRVEVVIDIDDDGLDTFMGDTLSAERYYDLDTGVITNGAMEEVGRGEPE